MAQFIMQPQFRNPWVQNLPNMLQNMALQGVAQKFKGRQLEQERKIRVGEREIDRERQLADYESARGFTTSERLADEKFKGGKEPGYGVVKGKEYYWNYNKKTGKLTKTETPVPITQGTQLSVDKDGNIRFTQGSPGELTKTNKSVVQKNVMSLAARKDLLESTAAKWQPHYNTWLTKGTMYLREIQEKASGLPGVEKVSPEKQEELAKFTSFRTDSIEDFAKLIHELGGATLTPHETRTYGGFIQNAKKDSATVYMTKLKQNYSRVTKQLARENYYLNIQGMKPTEYDRLRKQNKIMSVAAFDTMIDQKHAEYMTKLRRQKPDVPWEQIKAEADGMINASFLGF